MVRGHVATWRQGCHRTPVAAGLLGLTLAARHYEPGQGVSFQVFARTRIRGAVLDELRQRDPLSRGEP